MTVNVYNFGAIGDGLTDDTTAIQEAVDFAKLTGDKVCFGARKYLFSNVTVEDVLVEGAGVTEQDGPVSEGTIFIATDIENPLFNVKRGACFRGFSVYYPNQATSGVPVVYPPAFQGDIASTVTNVWFENVVAINPYIFLRIGDPAKTTAHGRIGIRNSTIYGIYRSLELYNLLDVIQISDCMFTWAPFNTITQGTQTLSNWTAANGDCIYADHVDGLQLSNVLIFGPHIALHVSNSISNLWTISNVIFDAALYALVIDGAADLANTSFASCNFHCYQTGDDAAAGSAVLVNGNGTSGTELLFSACHFAMTRGNYIAAQSSTLRSLGISNCKFDEIGTAAGASGQRFAISINDADARVSIQGCDFAPGYASSTPIAVVNAKTANIGGNTILGAQFPISISAISDIAVVCGNIARGTTSAKSLNLGAGVAVKTIQGTNGFDRP